MQKLQLSIPEPCHENWQQMTPTEQGRFCNACAKEVVDFSTMTDTQVLNYFSNLTHEKVCGRALPEQLDRAISRPAEPGKKLFWYWNYLVMCLMFFTRGSQANAQTCTKPATEVNPLKNTGVTKDMIVMGGVRRPESRIITGKVTDKDGNPVSFASVKIKGTNTGVAADANGTYSLRIKPGDIVEIFGAGFKSAEIVTDGRTFFSTVMKKDDDQIIIVTQGASCFGQKDRRNISSAQDIKGDIQINIIGQTHLTPVYSYSLYIIDGMISTKRMVAKLNQDDVEDYSILKGPEATALFGPEGVNGAVVITTRKSKEIKMQEVTVSSDFGSRRIAGAMAYGYTYKHTVSNFTDSLATIKTWLSSSVKVYPDPAQRSNNFSIALKLPEAGFYNLQVADASGKILLQQQISANAKTHVEQMLADSRWAAGLYYIRVFDTKHKLINKSSFIIK